MSWSKGPKGPGCMSIFANFFQETPSNHSHLHCTDHPSGKRGWETGLTVRALLVPVTAFSFC